MSESKVLTTLGLSNYEAEAYTMLLSTGTSTAEKISTTTRIPNGRIYDVLDSLAKRGIVRVQKSRPKLFIAVEPQLALKLLLEAKKTDLDREYDHMLKLASEVENQLKSKAVQPQKNSIFWTVAVGKEETIQLLAKIIDEAKEEILFCGGNIEVQLPELANALDALAKKFERGSKTRVNFKFLFNIGDYETISRLVKNQSLTKLVGSREAASLIRFVEGNAFFYDVVDGERVLIKIANPVKPDEYFAAITVLDRSLASELKKKFNELWVNGKQLMA